MHETSQEIEALQVLLDRSYESAGEHLLSIHNPKWRMSAREICSHLVKVCVLDLATVNASGNPRVAPVDGLFLGGRFWFGSSHKSQRFRHIRGNPNISAAYTKGEEVPILIHGIAHEIDTSSGNYERLHDYCREVYGDSYDKWGFWGKEPYARIEPSRQYAIRMQHD